MITFPLFIALGDALDIVYAPLDSCHEPRGVCGHVSCGVRARAGTEQTACGAWCASGSGEPPAFAKPSESRSERADTGGGWRWP